MYGQHGRYLRSAKPQNARQAVTLASDDTQRAGSMAGTFSMRLGNGTGETTTGTIQVQRVPSLVFDENLSISADGHTLPVTEVIDARHQMRSLTETETVDGEPVYVTIDITAINQPVHIAVPAASQVATLPRSGAGGI